jgi:hypothetical protein
VKTHATTAMTPEHPDDAMSRAFFEKMHKRIAIPVPRVKIEPFVSELL